MYSIASGLAGLVVWRLTDAHIDASVDKDNIENKSYTVRLTLWIASATFLTLSLVATILKHKYHGIRGRQAQIIDEHQKIKEFYENEGGSEVRNSMIKNHSNIFDKTP